MAIPEFQKALLDAMLEKAELCNKRIHLTGFWFIGFAAVGYFLGNGSSATLSILGASVPIPRLALIGATPVVLSIIFFVMSCFICLEDQYYKEIRRIIESLDAKESLSAFQLKLLEAPSWLTYHELREIAGSTPALTTIGNIANMLLVVAYVLVPFGVVGYFFVTAYQEFGFSWVMLIDLLSLLFAPLAMIQVAESLPSVKTPPSI